MIKYKKGITIIELIVSLALISVVLIFLMRLLVKLRKLDDQSLNSISYEEKIAIAQNFIQERIKDETDCTFYQWTKTGTDNADTIEISCTQPQPVTVTVSIANTNSTSEEERYVQITLKDGYSNSETIVFAKGSNFVEQEGNVFEGNMSGFCYTKYTYNIIDDIGNIHYYEINYLKIM